LNQNNLDQAVTAGHCLKFMFVLAGLGLLSVWHNKQCWNRKLDSRDLSSCMAIRTPIQDNL